MYKDEGSSVYGDLSRSGASVRGDEKEKKDSDHNERTKTASDGGGLSNIFFLGNTSKNMIINYCFVL